MVLVAFLLAFWPFTHKPKPVPPETVLVQPGAGKEIADDIADLQDVHDNYPWLKSWADPSLDVIGRLLDGRSVNPDEDLEQLRHDMKALARLEENATI